MKKIFAKVKGFLKENKKLMAVAMAVMCMGCMIALPASASDGTAVVTSDDFSGVLTALQAQISVATIVQVLVVLVGATVGLAFMWWGVRKLTAALMKAFKKGKISV